MSWDKPQLVARPTSYRNQCFKSKCEAVFARALDLADWLWQYEPLELKSGWKPDFWIAARGFLYKTKAPAIVSSIVEFKPNEITGLYRQELEIRFFEIYRHMAKVSCVLATGNPFDESVHRRFERLYLQNGESVWEEVKWMNKIFDKFDEARSYRFDLEPSITLGATP